MSDSKEELNRFNLLSKAHSLQTAPNLLWIMSNGIWLLYSYQQITSSNGLERDDQ